ncbi:hypothetical protein EV426DRAFT_535248 [Tirmania nivea]|nr:hypothetical protein EV426DRAFT_535248 [Tirmania nivea]
MLIPPFRTLHFEKYSAMVRMSSLLRAAWLAEPSPAGLDSWMLSCANQSSNGDQATSDISNPSELHTPWRDEIYYNWNHVFHDGFSFLQEAVCGIGGFHPPSHDILPLSSQREGPLQKVWNTNVMLIPAYLAPGAQVRMFSAEKDAEGKRKELGKFNGKNTTELWFLLKGNEVLLEVEEGTGPAREGPVAVLAVGIGCSCDKEKEDQLQAPFANQKCQG